MKAILRVMNLTKNQFEQNVNTRFWLHHSEAGRSEVQLIEVKNGPSQPRYEAFSLFFRGGLEQLHPQRIYAVEHDAMGMFDLFLVPVARESNGFLYEAVFNRRCHGQD
jgi:hypothetical protein